MKFNAKELRKKVKSAKFDAYLRWGEQYSEKFEKAASEGKVAIKFKFNLEEVITPSELKNYLETDGFTVEYIKAVSGDLGYEMSVSWEETSVNETEDPCDK